MTAYFIAVYVICIAYMILNFRYDIQMLQQNSYRIRRYYRWLEDGNFFSAWRLTDVALLFLLFSTLLNTVLASFVVAATLLVKIVVLLRRKYKKPLVFTRRVWRIYSVSGIISVAVVAAATIVSLQANADSYNPATLSLGTILLITIFSWIPVITAVALLTPVEKAINRRYYNEAASILKSMPELKVIGITGSYGKTSTKHYLNRILSEKYDVLMTPGSFNTPMGVIRTIREMMKPYNQVFICEMGAKQKGDVKEICDLVHPDAGIITAVGPMHLETFKTLENVQSTKFELADALPENGLIVVNNDFEACASRPVCNVDSKRYGVACPGGCDYRATDVKIGRAHV